MAFMISQTAEYAVRAAVCLGGRNGQPMTVREIAKLTRVPEAYLAKLLQALGRAGLLRSRRGYHGGFALARTPKSMTALQIISAVDPFKRIEKCPLGIGDHAMSLCPLHRRIEETLASVEKSFRDCTVADLIDCKRPGGGRHTSFSREHFCALQAELHGRNGGNGNGHGRKRARNGRARKSV